VLDEGRSALQFERALRHGVKVAVKGHIEI
jgi:hypothetical protein